MSIESLREHAKRWFGHPTLPTPGGVQMPSHDGDMATLEELQERIFDVLDEAFLDGRAFNITYDEVPTERFYYEAQWAAGPFLHHHRYWPDDRAAEKLSDWRAQRDGVA